MLLLPDLFVCYLTMVTCSRVGPAGSGVWRSHLKGPDVRSNPSDTFDFFRVYQCPANTGAQYVRWASGAWSMTTRMSPDVHGEGVTGLAEGQQVVITPQHVQNSSSMLYRDMHLSSSAVVMTVCMLILRNLLLLSTVWKKFWEIFNPYTYSDKIFFEK